MSIDHSLYLPIMATAILRPPKSSQIAFHPKYTHHTYYNDNTT